MKKIIKEILRLAGLMQHADKLRYFLMKLANRKRNTDFKKQYPDVILPPDYLMYESFQLDYFRYYINGRKTAQWLIDLVRAHRNLDNIDVFDWGCGPARIIRHLPELLPEAASYTGSDYNLKSIQWCETNLPDIRFAGNELMPPLPFEDESFDLVYGISIFTHLSAIAHDAWLDELYRILRLKGVLFLTLHGENFVNKLDNAEKESFGRGELLVRGQVKEGHRTFIAFHPEEFVKKWTKNFECLEHIPGKIENGKAAQDVWILRKN
ncbi:MAG: class I SAM-dependent methyltransferase [Bacteroidales bacterium]|nr:class I SAM-dependent methyltransferase [Bacteroidales bacterium]